MYINDIVYSTSVDGPGLRNSLYTQGCPIRCPGCHNMSLWNYLDGECINDEEDILDLAKTLCETGECTKITILGGEPLAEWNVLGVKRLCFALKEIYHCNIWLYSGYTLAEIQEDPLKAAVLNYIDVLVDGRYNDSQRFENGRFRGSGNQKIWSVTHIDEKNVFEDITETF